MAESRLPHDHGQPIEQKLENLPDAAGFQMVADLFKQLADPTRLRIFWLLCHCEECVINISSLVGMNSPAVSHHLKLLKSAGLIISRRDGKEVYYKAAGTRQVQLLHGMIEALMAVTCPAPCPPDR